MSAGLSRRRLLGLGAAGLAAVVVPTADASAGGRWRWQGRALGARASIILDGVERAEARRAIGASLAEIRRLEQLFSLYRTDSALVRLNRDGVLDAPPPEFVEILSLARSLWVHSDGAFDVTVQPLWLAHRRYFADSTTAGATIPEHVVEPARALVDGDAVVVERARVRLARRAMALTLNGIAQGFVADRVSRVLERRGIGRALLDVGEIRALGADWRIGVPGTEEPLVLDGAWAVATSTASGFAFEPSGAHHHLLDPASGRSASPHAAVTVVAPNATLADGLSTACALLDVDAAMRLVARFADVEVRLLGHDGEIRTAGQDSRPQRAASMA